MSLLLGIRIERRFVLLIVVDDLLSSVVVAGSILLRCKRPPRKVDLGGTEGVLDARCSDDLANGFFRRSVPVSVDGALSSDP